MNTPTTSAALGGADDQIRVLHRITPLEDWQPPTNVGPPFMKVAVIDLETDGLDPLYNEILEIAVAMIVIDRQGRILEVESVICGLQQPSRPIEPEIERITGITDAMVAGKRLVPQKIAEHLQAADACLAFHVAFDRRHLEMLVPEVGEMPWICAMADVDWHALGFDGRAQGYLLMQAGMRKRRDPACYGGVSLQGRRRSPRCDVRGLQLAERHLSRLVLPGLPNAGRHRPGAG
jgi:DNA polymerase-3 subunit epsilon